jgi:toxin ParE1/3/4
LQTKINSLANFPNAGRIVPELLDRDITSYREIVKSPWRIIYKIDNKLGEVLAVIDGRRNVQDVLLRKLLNR